MYRITIEKFEENRSATSVAEAFAPTKVYEQTVEELDIRAVMAGVNKRPRKSRAKQPASSTPSKQ